MSGKNHLVVIWSSGDRDVALKAAFMYAYNSKRHGWWENVTLIVWGPSATLLEKDEDLRAYVKKMKEGGVALEACKACSDMYGCSETLEKLGIDVKYMGAPLTDYLKDGSRVITF